MDEMIESKRPRVEVLNAMEASLTRVWEDVESLMVRRKRIADINSNFHEKLETCQSKISALELACRDTMIPMEVAPVEEFLHKFRAMRTDVLASVMATLKDGKELLGLLREIASEGTMDSRPDYLVADAIRAIKQVEVWLEHLHDRRNGLEIAWQSRREQLEQCLRLAILTQDLNEIEARLDARQNDMTFAFTLGESEKFVDNLLQEYVRLKDDAIEFRDRALRIAKATEKLVESGSFAGDESCAHAYGVLSKCTDFFAETDRRESLLLQAKDFFGRAERAFQKLEQFEVQITSANRTTKSIVDSPIKIYSEVLSQLADVTKEPIQLGYCLIDDVGRTLPEVMGIRRVVDELENRKLYLEKLCTSESEHAVDISEKLNSFYSQHNQILSWLVSNAEQCIKVNVALGTTLAAAQSFLHVHHKLMADLEVGLAG